LDPNGRTVRQWGRWGTEKGEFKEPDGIAVDAFGNIYVADTGNDRIQKFTRDGTFIRQWSDLGADRGRTERPRSIALGKNGDIYFTQDFDYRIHKLDPRAGRIWSWASMGMESLGRTSVWKQGLSGVGVDSSGTVLIADPDNACVQVFLSRGEEVAPAAQST